MWLLLLLIFFSLVIYSFLTSFYNMLWYDQHCYTCNIWLFHVLYVNFRVSWSILIVCMNFLHINILLTLKISVSPSFKHIYSMLPLALSIVPVASSFNFIDPGPQPLFKLVIVLLSSFFVLHIQLTWSFDCFF